MYIHNASNDALSMKPWYNHHGWLGAKNQSAQSPDTTVMVGWVYKALIQPSWLAGCLNQSAWSPDTAIMAGWCLNQSAWSPDTAITVGWCLNQSAWSPDIAIMAVWVLKISQHKILINCHGWLGARSPDTTVMVGWAHKALLQPSWLAGCYKSISYLSAWCTYTLQDICT